LEELWSYIIFDIFSTLSKKYPTLGQEKKVVYLGGAQYLIPFKVGSLPIVPSTAGSISGKLLEGF
jgi:hypothetical protein